MDYTPPFPLRCEVTDCVCVFYPADVVHSSHPPRNSHNKITSGNGDGGCSVNHPTSPERVCGLKGRQAGSGSRTSDTKVAPIMPYSGTSSHSDGSTDGSADETSMRCVTGGCRRGDARGTKKGPIYGSFASTVDNLDLAVSAVDAR